MLNNITITSTLRSDTGTTQSTCELLVSDQIEWCHPICKGLVVRTIDPIQGPDLEKNPKRTNVTISTIRLLQKIRAPFSATSLQ